MCGLVVLLRPEGTELLPRMLGAMSHRGINGHDKFFWGRNVSIGHRRLPIQGLDHRHDHLQYAAKGRFTGALVGEILNFREIDPGAESDLVVMLDQFAEHGPDAFKKFDGFWSAVIYDLVEERTFVATDYLSQKPLYIRQDAWAVASEIKPLLMLGDLPLNETYLSAVAKWGYCPDGSTPYKGITMLPAGSMLIVDGGGSSLYVNDTLSPRNDLSVREVMERSLDRRLIADVPVAVLCSGGLDSTIVFEMVKRRTTDFTMFHVDNGEGEYLNHLKIPPGVNVIRLDLEDVYLDDAIYWNESPVDLGSVEPQLALGRAVAKHGIKVVLSGDGADELFGGYRRAKEYDSQYSDTFQELPFYHHPRLDKLMMASTVELRTPYLGRGVVERALGVPYPRRTEKQALKTAFEDIVPRAILERSKHPLKTAAIRDGGQTWRNHLIETFRRVEKNYERG